MELTYSVKAFDVLGTRGTDRDPALKQFIA